MANPISNDPDAAAQRTCATCGAALAAGRLGAHCPRCLFGLASGFGLAGEAVDEDLPDPADWRGFGDYELIEEIARGGMGVVYRARQMSLGREVAIKMILAGELATAESVQRFRNEAAAAARLHHPNIVSVYEIGQHEMQHFFSMRLVSGRRNVATWAKGVAPSSGQIVAMMVKTARAVAFAHERGVLHRDLKPSNILVDEMGEPHVTDFGLAKLVNQDSGITRSAAMLGSPSYMAPEQADSRQADVTMATDVYGLGAVLYELLAGRPPFVGASPLATAKMVVEQMPERLEAVPRDLATICLKCLEKEPSQRYATALELAEDLERFARGEPIRARPITAPEALWRWARRRPGIAALLGALALALVLGLAGVTWQWRRAERANAQQLKTLDHLAWKEIVRQAGSDDAPIALAALAARLRADPGRWQAAMLAMSLVEQSAFPVIVGPPVVPVGKLRAPPRIAPDGRWFAATGEDTAVQVWDTATGAVRAKIALPAVATALAVAQGPFVLAVATKDAQVRVHAALNGPALVLARTGTEPINDLRFSADGSRLLARSRDRVEVWRCAQPEQPLSFSLDGGIRGAAISADGSRVLAWNAKRATVWEAESGQAKLAVAAQADFRQGALAAGGKRVALIDGAFVTRTWDVDAGTPLSVIDSPLSSLKLLALDGGGGRITLAAFSNELMVHDTASGLRVSPPMQHLYQPTALIGSGDGARTASYGRDGRAHVWDAATGRSLLGGIWLGDDRLVAPDFSHDGRALLLAPWPSPDGAAPISVWRESRTAPPRVQRVEGQRDFNGCRLSPDGRLGCLGLWPGKRAHVYELATGRVLLDAAVGGDVYVHLFSPDMRRYYALTSNGWLHGWSLDTGAPLWPANHQPGNIRPGEISPDGTRIIAGHNDGHIRIYDTATGALLRTLDHPGEVKTLRFAPDGSGRFLSASTDHLAHLWDLRTAEKVRTFAGHTDTILASAWSPDSRFVATASYDQTARVWDAATGLPVGRPMPHFAWLSHLEFSPDGRRLATACRDGTARLWHPRTGEPASPPLPQGSTAETVRFTRDGACLLVRDHLGFRFWDAENGEPVTVHYPAPASGGLGMDADSYRAVLSPDGTQVFLGYSMNEGALWTIPQPRDRVPEWFPDFLESLALVRLDASGTPAVLSGEGLLRLRKMLADPRHDGLYAAWARRILGLADR